MDREKTSDRRPAPPRAARTPALLGRGATAAACALVASLAGCASQHQPHTAAPTFSAPPRTVSGALVFSSPVTRAGAESGLHSRRDPLLSSRDVDALRATSQWPERDRPEERQIRTIYSRWGRSY